MDKQIGLSGTFSLNKNNHIHRWYPYIEGFSGEFVERELELIDDKIQSIYEPFGGSGTTLLVSAQRGIESFFSEINPFMVFVAETKINIVKSITRSKSDSTFAELESLIQFINIEIDNIKFEDITYDGFEKYFDNAILNKVLFIKNKINEVCVNTKAKRLALLALSSIMIDVSKMVRRGDLRFAKENEKSIQNIHVKELFISKVNEIINDILAVGDSIQSTTTFVSDDSRKAKLEKQVDCVITSPPYLNGTNYIRNTKLELKILDFIETESDLPLLHSKGIMAGINSVSKRRVIPSIVDEVKPYYEKLLPVAYDKRIPVMVNGYFYDMNLVFERLSELIRKNGKLILDIGDSQFAGVHIPTHEILVCLANKNGFELYDEEIIRTRRSKNQMILTQRVLRFELK